MACPRQGDLFGHDQPDPSDDEHETPDYHADPDEVRADLLQDSGRGARGQDHALGRVELSLYRTIFPQMTNWLPEDEGAQLRFEFEAELERLKAA